MMNNIFLLIHFIAIDNVLEENLEQFLSLFHYPVILTGGVDVGGGLTGGM